MKAVEEWRRGKRNSSSAAKAAVDGSVVGLSAGSVSSVISSGELGGSGGSTAGAVGGGERLCESGGDLDVVVSASEVDWDAAFSRLRSWPLYCSDDDVGRMTPRQTFELWVDVESWLMTLLDGAGAVKKLELPKLDGLSGSGELPSLEDVTSVREEYGRRVDSIRRSGGDWFTRMELLDKIHEHLRGMKEKEKGAGPMLSVRGRLMIPGIPEGLGLERYECFEVQDGELVDGYEFGGNVFSVKLSVVLDRTRVLIMELARRGALQGYGVIQGDVGGANRFAAHMCRQAEMIRGAFERVAFELDEEAGRRELSRLNAAGLLQQYKMRVPDCGSDEEFLKRFYAYLIECGLAVKSGCRVEVSGHG